MAFEKIEKYDEKTTREIAARVKEILSLLGEDPDREGLIKTPERVAKSLQFLTQGYSQNGEEIIRSAIFDEKYQQMVLVKDIELYSMCEHHMLPFIGKCHVAYIPNGKITGLSKIARVVETYAMTTGSYMQVLPRFVSVDENGTEREFLRDYFSSTAEMYDIIKSLNENDGITVIMISHDIGAALQYANKVLHIGKEIFFGSVDEYTHTRDTFAHTEGGGVK